MELGPIGGEEGLTLIYVFLFAFWAFGYDFWARPSVRLGFPPIWIVYSIVPIAYSFIAISELEHAAGAKSDFAILLITLLPMLIWISIELPRSRLSALLVGGLAMGGAGARFAGVIALVVVGWSLASQFERTLSRVRVVTGRGLFD